MYKEVTLYRQDFRSYNGEENFFDDVLCDLGIHPKHYEEIESITIKIDVDDVRVNDDVKLGDLS